LIVAGGVGANVELRDNVCGLKSGAAVARCFFPIRRSATDNGAMIALVGALRLETTSVGDYRFTP